jgi:hypothetical protein
VALPRILLWSDGAVVYRVRARRHDVAVRAVRSRLSLSLYLLRCGKNVTARPFLCRSVRQPAGQTVRKRSP